MPAAFGFSGLRSRLLLPVLLAAGPAAILLLLTGRAWREREQGDAIAAAREAGQHAALVHSQNLAQVRRMLATIAAVGVDRPSVDPTWRAVLVKAIDDHALFDNIGVVDADGGVESVAAPLDAATRRRIHELTSTTAARPGLSEDGELDVTPRGPTTLVIVPVGSGRSGAPRWLAAIVRLSWLRDTTALSSLPTGTIETISDRSGRMLLRVPESSSGRSADTSGDEIVRIALTDAGSRSPAISPVSRGAGDLPREATTPAMLFITIGMPRTAVTADADRFFRGTSAILLVSVALALTVAWRSTGRLSREIDGLLTTTTRLADGDSSRPASADASVEELARLSQGLDRLSATFARRERDIVRRHDHTLQGLSSALEQTADSVFITDRAGVIRYVNPAFEALTGYTRDEAIGQTPRLFSSGSHERKFYEGLWATILAGQVFRAIVTNRAKDGRLFNEDQTITPIRDQDGTITDFVSTGRDITERRRIDQALRRLNTALEHEAARIASVLHDEASQFLCPRTSRSPTSAAISRQTTAPGCRSSASISILRRSSFGVCRMNCIRGYSTISGWWRPSDSCRSDSAGGTTYRSTSMFPRRRRCRGPSKRSVTGWCRKA